MSKTTLNKKTVVEGLDTSERTCITAIPESCTSVVATYSIGEDRHTIQGHPADLYVQLDMLCSIYRNFRFHGWK
jgi:hypothetical protein